MTTDQLFDVFMQARAARIDARKSGDTEAYQYWSLVTTNAHEALKAARAKSETSVQENS